MALMSCWLCKLLAIVLKVMPAAILKCKGCAKYGKVSSAASLKTCGLTAQMTKLALCKTGLALSNTCTPNSLASDWRLVSLGSITKIWSAVKPFLQRPPTMALAILPPPIKAMIC